MFGRGLLAVGGLLRWVVVSLLPRWGTVWRWVRRLLVVGVPAAALGLESIAGVAHAGPAAVGPFYPGIAAIGLVCLTLAAAVPAVYCLVVFTTATGSLLGRRTVALGRAVTAVARRGRHGRRRGSGRRRSRAR
jgi:hypothetical protein